MEATETRTEARKGQTSCIRGYSYEVYVLGIDYEMLVVERSILHHWVDIDDTGILLDDKLLLPGVFSGQSYCFCFLVVSGLDHQPVLVGDFVVEDEVSHDDLLCCRPCYIPDDVDRSSAEHDRANSISNRNH